MTLSEITPFLSLIGTIVVGVILYRQIKSQLELLNNYKDYINTIDLNKLKQYHDMEKMSIATRSEIETQSFIQNIDSEFHHQFDEMATFTYMMLSQMTKEQRELAIRKHLTFSRKLFIELLKENDLHKNS
jgi:protein-arginine kinase